MCNFFYQCHRDNDTTTNTANARTTPPQKHLPTILIFKQLRIIMQRPTKITIKNTLHACVSMLGKLQLHGKMKNKIDNYISP